MNNLAIIVGTVTRISNSTIGTRQAVNLTVKTSIEVNNGKIISSFVPVQITMPTMVERCKTIQEGAKVAIEGRFETYTTSNGKKGYNVTQISSFQTVDEGNMNHVVMWGRITHEPEVRFTQNQNEVARFNIANSRRYKKEETWVEVTSFVPVTAWGVVANSAEKLQKGDAVWIIGKLISGSYTNKDNQKIYTMEINADHIIPGGSGKRNIIETEQGNVQQKPSQPQQYQNQAGQQNYQQGYQQANQASNQQYTQNKSQQTAQYNEPAKQNDGLPPFPGSSSYGNPAMNPPASSPAGSSGFINLDNFDEDEELPFP